MIQEHGHTLQLIIELCFCKCPCLLLWQLCLSTSPAFSSEADKYGCRLFLLLCSDFVVSDLKAVWSGPKCCCLSKTMEYECHENCFGVELSVIWLQGRWQDVIGAHYIHYIFHDGKESVEKNNHYESNTSCLLCLPSFLSIFFISLVCISVFIIALCGLIYF